MQEQGRYIPSLVGTYSNHSGAAVLCSRFRYYTEKIAIHNTYIFTYKYMIYSEGQDNGSIKDNVKMTTRKSIYRFNQKMLCRFLFILLIYLYTMILCNKFNQGQRTMCYKHKIYITLRFVRNILRCCICFCMYYAFVYKNYIIWLITQNVRYIFDVIDGTHNIVQNRFIYKHLYS